MSIRALEVVDDQHTSIQRKTRAGTTQQSLYPCDSITTAVVFPTTPRCLCGDAVDFGEIAGGDAFSILGYNEETQTRIHTSKAHIHQTSQHPHTHTHAYICAHLHTLIIINSSFFCARTSASSLCICRKALIFSSASSPEIDVPPDRDC